LTKVMGGVIAKIWIQNYCCLKKHDDLF